MNVKLNLLNIKNFKGIKVFALKVDGQNASILGDNAAGKTTIYDAFYWLLFDKDSANHATQKFGIKPMDAEGNEIHFLETEVEAELSLEGKPLKLKKILTENWVKPRGQEQQEYKGNETAYFFDEVPVKKGVYEQKIGQIIDEETFKLITNPLYFNDDKAFPWQTRRLKLFEICGNIKDEDIIAANPKLMLLPTVLDGKTVDDRKAIIVSSIKKLNEQIDTIGPKINENMRLIPETEVDYTATEAELASLKSQLDVLEKELAGAGSAAEEYRKKQQEYYSLKGQLESIKSRIYKEVNSDRQALVVEKSKLDMEAYKITTDISSFEMKNSAAKAEIAGNGEKRNNLLKEWRDLTADKDAVLKEIFTEPTEGSFVCPTCGQELPETARQGKLAEMRDKFEKNKNSKLDDIEKKLSANKAAGLALRTRTEELQAAVNSGAESVIQLNVKLKAISDQMVKFETELAQDAHEPNYLTDAEYCKVVSQIDALQEELEQPIVDNTSAARQQKGTILEKINNCNAILNNRDVVRNADDRIKELKKQEKDLAVQKSKLEGQIDLINLFIRTKANMLSEVINEKFKAVRFKLFDLQQNGGMAECCETLINTNGSWVPYSTNGNTAGCINAGMEIINTLVSHYGVSAPIFVDNAESVTELVKTPAQVIRLVKPDIKAAEDKEKYSKLIVEVQE